MMELREVGVGSQVQFGAMARRRWQQHDGHEQWRNLKWLGPWKNCKPREWRLVMQAGRSKGKAGRDSGGRIEKKLPVPGRPQRAEGGRKETDRSGREGNGNAGENAIDGRRGDRSKLGLTKDAANIAQNRARKGKTERQGKSLRDSQIHEGRLYSIVGADDINFFDPRRTTYRDDMENKPPEYYKYGPYGPHAWKGVPVGRPLRGTLSDDIVVFFSNVENNEEAEEREQGNCALGYEERVEALEQKGRMQFFFAFVGERRSSGSQLSWKDWTLAAQMAVQSEDDLDPSTLFLRVEKHMKDMVTRCTAWVRPDLIYVKKPGYELRLEPQADYIKWLGEVLDPAKGGSNPDSFYSQLCNIVGVDVNSKSETFVAAFRQLSQKGKLACWEHLLSNLPVPMFKPYESSSTRELQSSKDYTADQVEGEEFNQTDDEDDEEVDEEEFWREIENSNLMEEMDRDLKREVAGVKQRHEVVKQLSTNEQRPILQDYEPSGINVDYDDDDDEFDDDDDDERYPLPKVVKQARFKAESTRKSLAQRQLEAEAEVEDSGLQTAVRPFTELSLFREIAFIRELLVEQKLKFRPDRNSSKNE